jgi:radical SAM-linked protein
MIRLRFVYKKFGNIRFTSTLDIQKIWERTCRRSNLNIAYTQGFHPQARIQQAAPLPLGFEGSAEIVDIWINEIELPPNLLQSINQSLPKGLEVSTITKIDLTEKSLQNRVTASIYYVRNITGLSVDELKNRINNILNSHELLIDRRNKQVDLIKRINSLEIFDLAENQKITIVMNLKQLPGLTGRPEDVLTIMEIDPFRTIIERKQLFLA